MEKILSLIEQAEDVTSIRQTVLETEQVPTDKDWFETVPCRWSIKFTLQMPESLELIIEYRTYVREDFYIVSGAVYKKFGK